MGKIRDFLITYFEMTSFGGSLGKVAIRIESDSELDLTYFNEDAEKEYIKKCLPEGVTVVASEYLSGIILN
jgi:hypothetical protein